MKVFFFFKQKTAYEMCGRDWSSDVCSSDLLTLLPFIELQLRLLNEGLESEVRQRTKELERTNLNLIQEISERRQAQDKLHYQALHDKLTGLPNRASLESILAKLIAQPQKDRKSTRLNSSHVRTSRMPSSA